MKIRHLWLPALLLTLIGGAAKICDTVFTLNGQQFFIDSTACNFIFVGALLLLLIIGFVMSICDRKKSVKASPSKNSLAGIFGFISSVALIGSSVIGILGLGSSSNLSADLIYCILTLFGGAVLLFESCISFTGHNSIERIPVLSLAVPLWGCARLISLFMTYTKVSIQCTEMFDIISVALLVLFLFYQSMFFAQINQSTDAKKLTIYGLAFIMSAVVVTADLVIKKTYSGELTVSNILSYICDISFCGYAICLIRDIFKKSSVKDEGDDENDEKSNDTTNTNETLTEEKSEVTASTTVEPVIEEVKEAAAEPVVQEVKETVAEPVVQEVKETVAEPVKPLVEPQPQPQRDSAYDEIFKLLDEMSSNNK